jgi:hypothetical protein
MKQIVSILLAILILLQSFSKVWIYVSFKISQDRIAQTLCVQRGIKNNCCKGKCYLKKQLKNTDEQQQKQLSASLKEKSEVLYCQSFPKHSLLNIQFKLSKEKIILPYQFPYSSPYINEIFKPPKLI